MMRLLYGKPKTAWYLGQTLHPVIQAKQEDEKTIALQASTFLFEPKLFTLTGGLL